MNGLISKEMGLSDILVKNMVGIDLFEFRGNFSTMRKGRPA